MIEFVTFEQAIKLKEKGFPQHWSDNAYIIENEYDEKFEIGSRYPIQFTPDYVNTVSSPTIEEVLKWLREEKEIFIAINIRWCYEDDEHPFYEVNKPIFKGYFCSIHYLNDLSKLDNYISIDYPKFEQAGSDGINYVLEKVI